MGQGKKLGFVPFSDLIPAGVAEEKMVKVLREKYDKERRESTYSYIYIII